MRSTTLATRALTAVWALLLAAAVAGGAVRAATPPAEGTGAGIHLGRHWLARPHWVRSGARGECHAVLPGADEGMRFVLWQPGRRMIWACALLLPLDTEHRPLLRLAYEAGGMDAGGEVMVVGLVAQTGPRSAVVPVMTRADLGPSRGVRTLEVDLAEVALPGPVCGLAVHLLTRPAQMEPAWIELRTLSLYSRDGLPQGAGPASEPLTVRVLNVEGQPLQGALAAVDPERLDVACCAETDAAGRAVLPASGSRAAVHTVRAEKAGYAAVECPAEVTGETVVVLPAVRDGIGTVTTVHGGGIPGAVVRASLPCIAVAGQVCLLPHESLADDLGRWRLAGGVPFSDGSLGLLEAFEGERGRGTRPVGLSGMSEPWPVVLHRAGEAPDPELSTPEQLGMAGDVAALTALAADPLESDAFRLEAARELLGILARLPETQDDVLRGLLHAGARSREPLRERLLGLYLAALRSAGLPPGAAVESARRLAAAGLVPADLQAALQSRGSFWQRLFAGGAARGVSAGAVAPVPHGALAGPASAAALPAPIRVPEGPAREAAGASYAQPVRVPPPGGKATAVPLDGARLGRWLENPACRPTPKAVAPVAAPDPRGRPSAVGLDVPSPSAGGAPTPVAVLPP